MPALSSLFVRAARSVVRHGVVTSALLVVAVTAPHAATAEPVSGPGGAHIEDVREVSSQNWSVDVHSAAMDRTIPLTVLRPATTEPRPVLYLLNGAGGGEDGANWLSQTDVVSFFSDRDVNVVVPQAGLGSYYTDWAQPDPKIGQPRWETFLTAELPPLLDELLDTDGSNAIAGLSMSATSVLDLAARHPGTYRAVASYSGCARTSTPAGEAAVRAVVGAAAGADATNMWGPPGDPRWAEHDPYLQAENLRGTTLYISSGNGAAGPYDTEDAPRPAGSPPIEDQIVVGGLLEAAARTCTADLVARFGELGIPAEVHMPPYGTHSWLYWQDELHRSWPTIAAALGTGGRP